MLSQPCSHRRYFRPSHFEVVTYTHVFLFSSFAFSPLSILSLSSFSCHLQHVLPLFAESIGHPVFSVFHVVIALALLSLSHRLPISCSLIPPFYAVFASTASCPFAYLFPFPLVSLSSFYLPSLFQFLGDYTQNDFDKGLDAFGFRRALEARGYHKLKLKKDTRDPFVHRLIVTDETIEHKPEGHNFLLDMFFRRK